jgi:SAM-dependent methyltransferase
MALAGARRTVKRWRRRLPQPWSRVLATGAQLPGWVRKREVRRAVREEALIEHLVTRGESYRPQLVDMSERVIEVPWVLRRVPRDADRVLDVGTSYALDVYHRLLSRLPAREVHIVDLAPFALENTTFHQADVRALPFGDGEFHATLCISTLEHIGLDNSVYFDSSGERRDEDGDLAALRELGRVTRSGGRVFVTVPGGRSREMDWQRQYSPASWADVVQRAGLEIDEIEYFEHDPEQGWRPVAPSEVERRDYREGAPYAAALICAALRRATA